MADKIQIPEWLSPVYDFLQQPYLERQAREALQPVSQSPSAGFPLVARSAPIQALPSRTIGAAPGTTAGSALMAAPRPNSIPSYADSVGTPFGPRAKPSGRPGESGVQPFTPYTPPKAAETYINWVKGPIGKTQTVAANPPSYSPVPMEFPGASFFADPAFGPKPAALRAVELADLSPAPPRSRPSNAPKALTPPAPLVPGNIPPRAGAPKPASQPRGYAGLSYEDAPPSLFPRMQGNGNGVLGQLTQYAGLNSSPLMRGLAGSLAQNQKFFAANPPPAGNIKTVLGAASNFAPGASGLTGGADASSGGASWYLDKNGNRIEVSH